LADLSDAFVFHAAQLHFMDHRDHRAFSGVTGQNQINPQAVAQLLPLKTASETKNSAADKK
jgi:hypothetical protein